MSRYCIAEYDSSYELLVNVKPYIFHPENVQLAELNQERLLVRLATVSYVTTLSSQQSFRILASLTVFCNAVALGVLIRFLAAAV
jgi:hypothetical protein